MQRQRVVAGEAPRYVSARAGAKGSSSPHPGPSPEAYAAGLLPGAPAGLEDFARFGADPARSAPDLHGFPPGLAGSAPNLARSAQTWPGLEQTSAGLLQTRRGLLQTSPGLLQTCRGLLQTCAGREQTSPGLERFERAESGAVRLVPVARRRRQELVNGLHLADRRHEIVSEEALQHPPDLFRPGHLVP